MPVKFILVLFVFHNAWYFLSVRLKRTVKRPEETST